MDRKVTEKEIPKKYHMTEYPVFSGISVIYNHSHTQSGVRERADVSDQGDIFEIFHCREGRMECNIGEDFCYISPGDLLITKVKALSDKFYFPLRHYHGISVRIDVKKAPKCLSCFLEDVAVQPKMIEEKFCAKNGYFIARSNSSVEHIFTELYDVPDKIRHAYSKIKILELMLFLSAYDMEEAGMSHLPVAVSQAELAKDVAGYLTENMDEKITLEQAAAQFHVSATAIKNAMKSVYGVSFYAYIKAQKMESAAYMLEYTDKPVIEIANEHGYDNSSKFAAAFRSVKGMAPGEYRSQHIKIK